MEITALCAVAVCLRVSPSRSQFFQYESVTLSCEGNSSEFRVRKNTSKYINLLCPSYSTHTETECILSELYDHDSGVYWCESAAGERSDAVNISVTDEPLILERPESPVIEGEAVTFHCRFRPPLSSNLTRFYRNGVLVGSSSTGRFAVRSVSKSDEGFYKCDASGVGQSAETWLDVRGSRPQTFAAALALILLPAVVGALLIMMLLLCVWRNHKRRRLQTPTAALAHILLPVMVGSFLLIVTVICFWRNHEGSVDSIVSYTVTITQEGKTHRIIEPQDGPVLGRVQYVGDSLTEERLSCHQSRLRTENSRGSL